ncbi:MAG: glycosyltransferase [Pseudomonadales bacterium]|nr:glycosyltransferase [Pseudomonadales bacterium]
MIRRFGNTEGFISMIIPAAVYGLLAMLIFRSMWPYFYYVKNETFVAMGLFALWRYGWITINYTRSIWYDAFFYPKLRKTAFDVADEQKYPDHIFFIIPSYKEESWVTIETFQSILSNLATVPCSSTLIVSTGSDLDDHMVASVYQSHPVRDKVDLILQRQDQGKRIAMGHALRAAARRYDPRQTSITVFMDGDSYLESYTLKKTLPFFPAFPHLGALTTNEAAYINTRNIWYKDWFNLKFGQRHVLFKSHSLSRKVLTLTGRYSMFRTEIVIQDAFIEQIENDILTLWMDGKFRFLMGDDKSSWFYLLKQGWEMLYIPDVTVYSLESRDANFFTLSTQLPYRWYGNTLRNNGRALALGPRKTGFFIWLVILDQRLSMWTSLVGITGAIVLSLVKSFIYLPFYIAWVLCVRIIQMSVIAMRGHPVSMRTLPLMLYNQWVGAFIKIHAGFHLSNQSWSKGGVSQGNKAVMIEHPLVKIMPDYMMLLSGAIFFVTILFAQGALVSPDPNLYSKNSTSAIIDTRQYGVKPNDGMDDSLALQQLIDHSVKGKKLVLVLPEGVIDLMYGVVIQRDDLTIKGHGSHKTIIHSHIKTPAKAIFEIKGSAQHSPCKLSTNTAPNSLQVQLSECDYEPGAAAIGGDFVLLKMPNSQPFFETLGNPTWNKPYPWLRQSIARVIHAGTKGNSEVLLVIEHPTGIEYETTGTKLQTLSMVRNTQFSDFTLKQVIPGALPADVTGKFENSYSRYAVDAISFNYAADCLVNNVVIKTAGRHPVNLENSYGCTLSNVHIDGAWNKGKSGNGYLRIARSHYNQIEDTTVENIRHITLQWSSSYNQLVDLDLAVDINFHGGYSHHNSAENIRSHLPENYPWQAISRTAKTAKWAPPDGSENNVTGLQIIH